MDVLNSLQIFSVIGIFIQPTCIRFCFLWALDLCALVETRHVRVGSDISLCGLRCPNTNGVLELYTKPGSVLLELSCQNDDYTIHPNFINRLDLNISSGCCVLREAQKKDTCVYEIEFHSSPARILSSTPITVIEPVVISNVTTNTSESGSDISLHVLFSGEETTVTWEVDRGEVPDRYQLRDQNRTLIIPSAQKEDAGKRFMVRVTNLVSEGTWEHVLEIRDNTPTGVISYFYRNRTKGFIPCGAALFVFTCCVLYLVTNYKRDSPMSNQRIDLVSAT
ncbi:uncharacterized protein LOC128652831 [Bombina bombina]|uniref:uncharacterized protein LOC128652831 n=1 Tax=Bombina bombina TaxID=8345 RepID=UPI00235B12B7|nr:uncharacterized protein LOC128652831 [Bombina bombina]